MRDDGKSEFVGTKEASEILNCSQATISKHCREGIIQGAEHDRKGSPWRIPRKAIENILKRNEKNIEC